MLKISYPILFIQKLYNLILKSLDTFWKDEICFHITFLRQILNLKPMVSIYLRYSSPILSHFTKDFYNDLWYILRSNIDCQPNINCRSIVVIALR